MVNELHFYNLNSNLNTKPNIFIGTFIEKTKSYNLSDFINNTRFTILVSLVNYAATSECGSLYLIQGLDFDYCKATKIAGDDIYSPKLEFEISETEATMNITAYDDNGASFSVIVLL